MAQVTIDMPTGGITNTMIKAAAGINASKIVRHQSIDNELFGPATTVTALTKDVHIVRGATGTLVGFQAAINGAIATGADRTVTVELLKSTGGGSFSTVLSGTIDFTDASVLRTAVSAVISNTSLVAGDLLRITVAVAGAADNQAIGLLTTVTLEESYN